MRRSCVHCTRCWFASAVGLRATLLPVLCSAGDGRDGLVVAKWSLHGCWCGCWGLCVGRFRGHGAGIDGFWRR